MVGSWMFFQQWSALPQADLALEPRELSVHGHLMAEPLSRRGYHRISMIVAGAALAGCLVLLEMPRWTVASGEEDSSNYASFFSIGTFHFFDSPTTTSTSTTTSTTTVTTTSKTSTTVTTTRTSTTRTSSSTSTTGTTSSTTTRAHADSALTMPGDLCDFGFDVPSATSPAAKCFCQLAENGGCAGLPCMCPQGCAGTAWNHPRSVTFVNKAKAFDCNNSVSKALLTIPRSYLRDIGYAKFWCPRGVLIMMTEMIREGFRIYQEQVMRGTVRQCLHSGVIASVPWLHLHTIGQGGFVDNMFHTTKNVWCHDMEADTEAQHLAVTLLEWAGGYPIKDLFKRPKEPPASCAVMGCGTWGPKDHCSCDPSCKEFGICCADYEERCYSTCKQIGCGNAPEGNNCTCEEGCKETGKCCRDASHTCGASGIWKKIEEAEAKAHKSEEAKEAAKEEETDEHSPPASHSDDDDEGDDHHLEKKLLVERLERLQREQRAEAEASQLPRLPAEESEGGPDAEFQSQHQPVPARYARESSCLVLGCGPRSSRGTCSCHSTCRETQDCCDDFVSTCRQHLFKRLRK